MLTQSLATSDTIVLQHVRREQCEALEDVGDSIGINYINLKLLRELLIKDSKLMDKAGILLTSSLMDSFKCYPIKYDTVSSEYSEYESMKRFETRGDLRHSDILDSTHEINECFTGS